MRAVFEAPKRRPRNNPPQKIINRLGEMIVIKRGELLKVFLGPTSSQERTLAEYAFAVPVMARSDFVQSLYPGNVSRFTPVLYAGRRILADFIAESPVERGVLRDSVFFDKDRSTADNFEIAVGVMFGRRSSPQDIALAAMGGEVVFIED